MEENKIMWILLLFCSQQLQFFPRNDVKNNDIKPAYNILSHKHTVDHKNPL